ncbi:MAG: hypothetical protein AAFP17_03880 [Pseudomonadota bacterium]
MPRRFRVLAGALCTAIILLSATTSIAATEAATPPLTAQAAQLEGDSRMPFGEGTLPAALPLLALGFAALLFYRMRWR